MKDVQGEQDLLMIRLHIGIETSSATSFESALPKTCQGPRERGSYEYQMCYPRRNGPAFELRAAGQQISALGRPSGEEPLLAGSISPRQSSPRR